MKKIQSKRIYKIQFNITSPLIIGSDQNEETDRDILKNRYGIPYIPGSAIAGVCRERLMLDEDKRNEYFGYVDIANKANQKVSSQSSRILFFDANICEECKDSFRISRRDSVKLDNYKTAIDGAKFDTEILEPGITFETYIVENVYEDEPKGVGDEIADMFLSEDVYFGAKTMRGFGAIGNVSIGVRVFDFTEVEDMNSYLDFDMINNDNWNEYNGNAGKKTSVVLKLKLKGGISVRRYTTDVKKGDEFLYPDMEQLTINGKGGEVPVVPGTSWAGAFLHRVKIIDSSIKWDELFGMVDEKQKKKKRSIIRFSESQIENSISKIGIRNAIDRFTGGTVNQALFTEKTYYGGNTTLELSFDKDDKLSDQQAGCLAAAIADLHYGYMAIGGATSIGRGLFKVEAINGQAVNDDNVFEMALAALK